MMLVILGIVALYLGIGVGLAKWDLPHAWDRAREEWDYSEHVLRYVKESMFLMIFFWPFRIVFLVTDRAMTTAAVRSDPQELKRRLREQSDAAERRSAEQRNYIKKLERELGIGG